MLLGSPRCEAAALSVAAEHCSLWVWAVRAAFWGWLCIVCSSTDGVWCCLTCGHVGCGRREQLPALGSEHSRHHFQAMWMATTSPSFSASGDDGGSGGGGKASEVRDGGDCDGGGNHEFCLDVLSRAVHCYLCDDYVISDAPWLALLQTELEELETKSMSEDADEEEEDVSMVDADDDDGEEAGGEGSGGSSSSLAMVLINSAKTPPSPQLLYPSIPIDDDGGGKERRRASMRRIIVPGCTGLTNLRNTCYMNSVMQALSHCSGFRSFFRDFLRAAAPLRLSGRRQQRKKNPPNRNARDEKDLAGGADTSSKDDDNDDVKVRLDRQTTARHLLRIQSAPAPAAPSSSSSKNNSSKDDDHQQRLALTEMTHIFLRVLWSGRWKFVAPRSFVHAVWNHGGLFAAQRQQDASEFLGFVLDRLNNELSPWNDKEEKKEHMSTGPRTVLTPQPLVLSPTKDKFLGSKSWQARSMLRTKDEMPLHPAPPMQRPQGKAEDPRQHQDQTNRKEDTPLLDYVLPLLIVQDPAAEDPRQHQGRTDRTEEPPLLDYVSPLLIAQDSAASSRSQASLERDGNDKTSAVTRQQRRGG